MQVLGDLRVVSYWIDTLVLKNRGKYLSYFVASPFPLQGKTNTCSRGSKKDFWSRCRGDLRSSQDIPSTHHKLISLTFTLFAICLSFSSPPLHPCHFIRPLFSVRLPFAMAESKRTKGSLPSYSTLDSPSVLSKLLNNDAMERPTGFTNENLNNFVYYH